MRNIRASKPLTMLLRIAILGISQGIATLVAVILALMGCEVRTLMIVMLTLGVAGIAIGDRATRPTR